MKTILLGVAGLALCSGHVIAGQLVHQSMYVTNTILIGEGITQARAEEDALSALPEGFVRDPGNSPQIECSKSTLVFLKDEAYCNPEVEGNLHRIYIPVLQAQNK